MRLTLINSTNLVCPVCRGRQRLEAQSLVLDATEQFALEGLLICANVSCGAQFPIVQGVPVLFANMPGWWAGRGSKILLPTTNTVLSGYFSQLESADPVTDAQRDSCRLYLAAHFGYLSDNAPSEPFWQAIVDLLGSQRRAGIALDLGCAVGRMTFELGSRFDQVIGLDSDLTMLIEAARADREQRISFERCLRAGKRQRIEGSVVSAKNVLFVCADAMNPPVGPEQFDFVAALNILDNVNPPLTLLQQIDALLKPDASLLLASPYNWRADITERGEWLENDSMDAATMVRAILADDLIPAVKLRYRIGDQRSDVPWVLRHHDRHYQHYSVDTLIAQKVKGHASTQ